MTTYTSTKAALTKAIKSGDRRRVEAAAVKAVAFWDSEIAGWPDNYTDWDRALFDVRSEWDVDGIAAALDAGDEDVRDLLLS